MVEIIFAYTKYIPSLQLVRYSPPQHTVQDKSKTSTMRYNEARYIVGGLREGFNGYTDNEKTFTVTLSRIRDIYPPAPGCQPNINR